MAIDLTNRVQGLLTQKDYIGLKRALERCHPSDIARVIDELSSDSIGFVFRLLPKNLAIEVFDFMDVDRKQVLLRSLGGDMVAMLLNEMSPDDRTELFEELPAKVVKKYLSLLSDKERHVANMLLGYREESAGRLMTTDFVDLKEDQTVDDALAHVRKTAPDKETIYHLYVISRDRRLVGGLSLKELMLAPGDRLVGEIMHPDVVRVSTDTDQEDVARVFEDYGFLAVPVVDREDRLVGIITHDDILEVVREEDTEDIHRMGGLGAPEEEYFRMSLADNVKKRVGWLALLVLFESFSSNILKVYSASLEAVVALAFFIPTLIDTGGNTGTQSATLVIRGMATGEIDLRQGFRVMLRECAIGVVLGLFLGAFAYVRAYLTQADVRIAFVVGLSLLVVIAVSNVAGAFLPLAAKRLRVDPAVMAGPFITTVVDIIGLIVYFEVARIVIGLNS
ncbi:MAG: magnesium transporter [Firmicutes bacterium]|nr:magnesium transporter [Bacillota bacterium]MDH7494461.1 magnesium transporter [Bacillota bacterium]